MEEKTKVQVKRLVAVHVIPGYDIKEHEETRLCWCHPELASRDPDTGEEVWAHNGFASQYYPDKKIN